MVFVESKRWLGGRAEWYRSSMRAVLCLAVALGALSVSSAAFAQAQPVPVDKRWMPPPTPIDASQSQTPAPASGSPEADKPAEAGAAEKEEEGRWNVSLDAVLGFGGTPVVNQKIIGPLITQESRTLSTSRFVTQSFNPGLSYEVVHNLRIGVMVPLGAGSLYPPGDTRGGTVIGNVVIGGEYEARLSERLKAYGGFDVALPTASGSELPTPDELARDFHLNQSEHDRFSLLHAMSDSRGREDTAAFAPKHLGLVPKVGVVWRVGTKVEIEPYAKYESLHATGTNSSYEGAIVVAARLTYRLDTHVDATLRAWTNIPTAGPDSAVAVAEPQLRGHFGGFMPILGVVLPFAGELTNPYVIGVRLTLAARF